MLLLIASPSSSKDVEGDDQHHYITLFDDHSKGDGVMMAPHSILKRRAERERETAMNPYSFQVQELKWME